MEEIFKKVRGLLISGALLFIVFSILPATAEAATLYFSPSSGLHAVGTTLSVSVYVSSADQAMNAASGIILFPSDKLEVTTLSKAGSIFSLWVQEPSFSNSVGTINFEGIALNPGFTGASGKLITINFKIKAAGTALLNFSSGSALANDGKGTNILTSLGSAQLNLGGAAPVVSTIPEATVPSVVYGTPSAPQISSSTHSDSTKWYPLNTAKFDWTTPSDITSARLLFNKFSNSTPTVTYTPAINEKGVMNLNDGVWYFHVQLRNAKGWGTVSHFRFQVDAQSPEPFEIKFLGGNETDNPRPTVIFDTTDTLSGMDYYKVKIGEEEFFALSDKDVKSNPYTLPFQMPGKRNILVQAFDRAGNSTTASAEFTILPPPSTLVKVGAGINKFLVTIIPLTALIILLAIILLYGWRKLSILRKKIKKEVREAESALHKAFDLLKEDIREQIKMLEKTRTKRSLTEEEEEVVKRLKKDLDTAEKFVKKEIEDIEKEVK